MIPVFGSSACLSGVAGIFSLLEFSTDSFRTASFTDDACASCASCAGCSACESAVAWLGLFSASATLASGLVESGLASGAGS